MSCKMCTCNAAMFYIQGNSVLCKREENDVNTFPKVRTIHSFFVLVRWTLGWSKFWKSAQIMPIRLNVAYFWPTWRKELEFWTPPPNWVCPAHVKIWCLCSKGQKFNVMDFAKNSPVPLFWCEISIFKTICNNIYQQNWKKLNFVIFAFS